MTKRIGLIGENSLAFVKCLLRIWGQGNCAVLVDWRMPLDAAVSLLKEAGAETCYIENRFYHQEAIGASDILFQCFENTAQEPAFLEQNSFGRYLPSYSEEEAVILFSSGTTGKSKGIKLSYKAINLNADYIIQNQGISEKDCLFIVCSFAHASGLVNDLLVALKTKARTVICPTLLHPRYAVYLINKFQVTRLGMVPTLLATYLQEISRMKMELPSLRLITVSGALLLDKWVRFAKELIPTVEILNQYGLSEAGPRVAAQTREFCTPGSVGVPICGDIQVKIADEQENPLPNGEIGLLYVKTPCLCSGYVSGREMGLTEDGWLNTHDLAYMRDGGEIFVVGRADDVISTKASLVYPGDVEAVILEVAGVRECAVFGCPDDVYGEVILCCYTADDDAKDISEEIRAWCKERLMEHERPKVYCSVPVIPKGTTGKISRKKLAELYKGGALHGCEKRRGGIGRCDLPDAGGSEILRSREDQQRHPVDRRPGL